MHVLILEDEIPAHQKLENYLNDFFSNTVKHDWARSKKEAQQLLVNTTYDFILSDIQLLDGISFDLFDTITVNCPIIFCTAHDDYLFRAFDTNGIAYLLKPYSKEDFDKALEKYEKLFQKGDYRPLDHTTINQLKSALTEEQVVYKKRFVIKKPDGLQLLQAADISFIEASGDFCIAVDFKGKRHPISEKMGIIEEQLNPQKFFRINRSQIVHIQYIINIENHFKNRLLISLEGGKEKFMTSSAKTSNFRQWIEG